MPAEPLKLAAKPSKWTEDDEDDEVEDVDDVGMIVLPAAAAALNIDSPGLNKSTQNRHYNTVSKYDGEREGEDRTKPLAISLLDVLLCFNVFLT